MVKTSSIAGPKTFDKNEKGRIYPAQSPVKQQLLTIIPYRRMLTLSATKGPITSGILRIATNLIPGGCHGSI